MLINKRYYISKENNYEREKRKITQDNIFEYTVDARERKEMYIIYMDLYDTIVNIIRLNTYMYERV